MAKDDYFVIVYKVLSFLYQCLKSGVQPSYAAAKELAGCNDVYWDTLFNNLIDDGYIKADVVATWNNKYVDKISITTQGVAYLENNSAMHAVKDFLGKAFEAVLEAAIKATAAF